MSRVLLGLLLFSSSALSISCRMARRFSSFFNKARLCLLNKATSCSLITATLAGTFKPPVLLMVLQFEVFSKGLNKADLVY